MGSEKSEDWFSKFGDIPVHPSVRHKSQCHAVPRAQDLGPQIGFLVLALPLTRPVTLDYTLFSFRTLTFYL